jgi:hypothetical protein
VITPDPDDHVFVDLTPARPPRGERGRSRRQVTIVDGDWSPVGDAADRGGVEGKLQSNISINGLPLVVELLASELFNLRPSTPAARSCWHLDDVPELRVRGRHYKLLAVYAT